MKVRDEFAQNNEISQSALFVPPGRFSKVIAEKTLSKKVLGQPVKGNFIALHFPSNRGRCIFSPFRTFAFNDTTNLGIVIANTGQGTMNRLRSVLKSPRRQIL